MRETAHELTFSAEPITELQNGEGVFVSAAKIKILCTEIFF